MSTMDWFYTATLLLGEKGWGELHYSMVTVVWCLLMMVRMVMIVILAPCVGPCKGVNIVCSTEKKLKKSWIGFTSLKAPTSLLA